jgi:hypothetical protein
MAMAKSSRDAGGGGCWPCYVAIELAWCEWIRRNPSPSVFWSCGYRAGKSFHGYTDGTHEMQDEDIVTYSPRKVRYLAIEAARRRLSTGQ